MGVILVDAPRMRNGEPTTDEVVTSYTDTGHGLPILVILSNWRPAARHYARRSTFRVEEVPAAGGRGFILHRSAEDKARDAADADDHYATFVATSRDESNSCTCRGHCRYGYCRHVDAIRALLAAGRIERPEADRAPDPVTAPGYLLYSDLELLEPAPF